MRQTTPTVPTLQPDLDPLPARCPHCASSGLQHREQMAGELFGSIVCMRCGTTVAYTRAPLRPRPQGMVPPSQLRGTAAPPTWRRPDCVETCIRVRVLRIGADAVGKYRPEWMEHHDIDAHLRYQNALTIGLAVLVAHPPAPASAVIRTGWLAFDPVGARCMIGGLGVDLSPVEMEILHHLGRRLGRVCTIPEIAAEVWPNDVELHRTGRKRTRVHDAEHIFRSAILRLRAKLGPEGRLLANRPGHGYVLLDEPYLGPVDFPLGEARSAQTPRITARVRPHDQPWAQQYERCVQCSTTDREHKGRGYCRYCYNRTFFRMHPPADLRLQPT